MRRSEAIHPNAAFYVSLLDDPQVRERIATVEACQEIIDIMEDDIPHEYLPECYDFLVGKRNLIRSKLQKGG